MAIRRENYMAKQKRGRADLHEVETESLIYYCKTHSLYNPQM